MFGTVCVYVFSQSLICSEIDARARARAYACNRADGFVRGSNERSQINVNAWQKTPVLFLVNVMERNYFIRMRPPTIVLCC